MIKIYTMQGFFFHIFLFFFEFFTPESKVYISLFPSNMDDGGEFFFKFHTSPWAACQKNINAQSV